MKSSSGQSTEKKRKREVCTICCGLGKNGNGHIADFCAYEGGPYHNNLKGALEARKHAEQQRKRSIPTTSGASDEDLQTKIGKDMDNKIILLMSDINDESEEARSSRNFNTNAIMNLRTELSDEQEKMRANFKIMQDLIASLQRKVGNLERKYNGW
jgi:hypothetical protein